MSDTVVYRPTRGHRCDVGWEERTFTVPSPPPPPAGRGGNGTPEPVQLTVLGQWDDPGTVRRCDECGQHWVAREVYQHPGRAFDGQRIEWRRERWWQRQRRKRKATAP